MSEQSFFFERGEREYVFSIFHNVNRLDDGEVSFSVVVTRCIATCLGLSVINVGVANPSCTYWTNFSAAVLLRMGGRKERGGPITPDQREVLQALNLED